MKHLILIAAMLATMSTKLLAQENAIEIKGIKGKDFGAVQYYKNPTPENNHEFEILANEDVDISLKIKLKEEGNINVLVTNKKGHVILSKKYSKKGDNRIELTMNKNEKYLIKLLGDQHSKMIVEASKN